MRYKKDVERIIFKLQADIEKATKQINAATEKIQDRENDIAILKEISKYLPEKQPGLPGLTVMGKMEESKQK